ncbi:MAG: cyclic nucleotide-binding domain-containing protein [Proteobacteria bacterium]|nr:cyclic nucleotide-binding domain-containing protein [Pseudomonadota bacterium]
MAKASSRPKFERRSYSENHHLFREQEVGDHAFILEEGTVEITRLSGSKEVVLGTIHKGGMFGEMALIDDSPRMASARAVGGPVKVMVISRDAFKDRVEGLDPFTKALVAILSDHVRSLASQLTESGSVLS